MNKKLRNENDAVGDILEREENVETLDNNKKEVINSPESQPVFYVMDESVSKEAVPCPTLEQGSNEPVWVRGAEAENHLKTVVADMVKKKRAMVIREG